MECEKNRLESAYLLALRKPRSLACATSSANLIDQPFQSEYPYFYHLGKSEYLYKRSSDVNSGSAFLQRYFWTVKLFMKIGRVQDRYVPCPVVSPAQGVFSASRIKKGALVAVEAGDDEYPINLVLYKYENGLCREELVAKYSIEVAAPQVDSFLWEN
ncbi:hypothetical protein ACU4GD_11755 [Cupriavidus basilensis]